MANILNDIKSVVALENSYVTFHNKTQRIVDVIWINYEGNPVVYKQLHPGEYHEINTFVTHPWMFKDSVTRDPLVVNCNEVYMPIKWNREIIRAIHRENRVVVVPRRSEANITLPIYPLVNRAMQIIRNSLHESIIHDCLTDSYSEINNLGLPEILKLELVQFIKKSRGH